MKAIYYTEHGGPDVLRYGDLDEPAVGALEVKVEVRAASLNHIDLFLRRGLPGIEVPFPHIPGCDATLCVEYKLVGEMTQGTCCERIVIPARNAIPFPDSMSFEEAASLSMVFVTAWRMLITRARLRAGEDVLVLGASAGVGVACIQIAKVAGARVFAAAGSAEKLALCEKLGSDVLINYKEEDFARRVRAETLKRGVDVVVDYVGRDTWAQSLKALSRGGRLVTCGATTGYDAQTDLRHVFFRQLEIIGSTMGSRSELMAALGLVFAGRMKPVIGGVYALADTAKAHAAMENRETLGKVVIRVGAGN